MYAADPVYAGSEHAGSGHGSYIYVRVYILGPNKDGLVTYIQVNVYIGNMLSWLNDG